MASKEKCVKCFKAVKDGVQCFHCDCFAHAKCVCLSDELFEMMRGVNNVKWFCDACVKSSSGMKVLSKIVVSNHDDLIIKMDAINEVNVSVKAELDSIKRMINVNDEKINMLGASETKLNNEIGNLKSELNVSWASIVGQEIKKNINIVSEEVKMINKTLSDVNESKARENNIIMFNLIESEKDKKNVMSVLQSLTGNVMKDGDVAKIMSLGRRAADVRLIRPVIIKFNNSIAKSLVMKNLFAINC